MISGLRTTRLGAWFGVLALAVQLYLPIHLVRMVEAGSAAAIAAPAVAHHHHSAVHPVADQSHHDSLPGSQPGTGHAHCPICSMLHGVVAIALPDSVGPQHPTLQSVGSTPVPESHELASASPASYASRGPPSSLG